MFRNYGFLSHPVISGISQNMPQNRDQSGQKRIMLPADVLFSTVVYVHRIFHYLLTAHFTAGVRFDEEAAVYSR